MLSHGPGGFLGAMALLTDTPYRGSTFAVGDTVLFEVDGEELRRLAFTHAALMRQFLPAMESVSGAVKGIERDREKLLAVGSLAAGLAHELNNPAAAAARAVATLGEYERQRGDALTRWRERARRPSSWPRWWRSGSRDRRRPASGSTRSRRATARRSWSTVERRGIADGYRIASELSEAGLRGGVGRSASALAWARRGWPRACATWPAAPGPASCTGS